MSEPETGQTEPAAAPSGQTGLIAQLGEFVNNMDARAWRAVAVAAGMVVFALAALVVTRIFFENNINEFIDSTLGEARRTHWALPATILVFTLTAYVAAPQFILITACVVAFGPEVGFWYSWAATIVSGVATYFTGRLAGEQTRKRFSGATGGRFTRFMGQNGFLASLIVRNLPTAPFIVVNTAFGAARVNFWAYIAGLAIGVLPKTAIVAFAGDGIMDALEGKIGSAAAMGAAAIAVWILAVYIVRRWWRRERG